MTNDCTECGESDSEMAEHNPEVCQVCFRSGLEQFWTAEIRRDPARAERAIEEARLFVDHALSARARRRTVE